jgi:hypothetical protein
MWKYLNKGISTPIAITIILILVIAVGGFAWWQYEETSEDNYELESLTKNDLVEPEIQKGNDLKDKILVILDQVREELETNSEIEEVEFYWKDTQVAGKGFYMEITDNNEKYENIKNLLSDKGFSLVYGGDATLKSVLGFQKDNIVCTLVMNYQDLDYFACGELSEDYEESRD